MCRATDPIAAPPLSAPSAVIIDRSSPDADACAFDPIFKRRAPPAAPIDSLTRSSSPPPPQAFAFARGVADFPDRDDEDDDDGGERDYDDMDDVYLSDDEDENDDDDDDEYMYCADEIAEEEGSSPSEAERPCRRVRFSSDPIMSVNYRPRTEKSDKGELHYTKKEIKKFRRAFKEELVQKRRGAAAAGGDGARPSAQVSSEAPAAASSPSLASSLSSQLWGLLSLAGPPSLLVSDGASRSSSNSNSSAALVADTMYLF